jgi:hemerythrin
MELIQWSEKYSVNIAEIDGQHKKLISILNQLADAMTVGKGPEVLDTVLKALVDYTAYHFSTEEQLFQKHGYTAYDEHKKQHDDLTARVKKLQEDFEGGNWMLTIEVLKFLSTWLSEHILGEDRKYGPYLNSRGVR